VLSAVTPALIVAPSLKDKKVLAALPAVVVAVAVGLIGEFDFKNEAARFDTAQVQLETERSMFVAGGGPFYAIASPTCQQTAAGQTEQNKTECPVANTLSLVTDPTDAPFAPPHSYTESRANFAYRIEKIRQTVASERDQFLRGKPQQPSTAVVKQNPPDTSHPNLPRPPNGIKHRQIQRRNDAVNCF
jgi:hypothetical protein